MGGSSGVGRKSENMGQLKILSLLCNQYCQMQNFSSCHITQKKELKEIFPLLGATLTSVLPFLAFRVETFKFRLVLSLPRDLMGLSACGPRGFHM